MISVKVKCILFHKYFIEKLIDWQLRGFIDSISSPYFEKIIFKYKSWYWIDTEKE